MSERYAFLADWHDPISETVWRYELLYYPATAEIEMVDLKSRKTFLRRSQVDTISPALLLPGAVVQVYSRQLKIIDYADRFTRSRLEAKRERTLAMIKPDALHHFGEILAAISDADFVIGSLKMCRLTKQEAQRFYAVHDGKPFFAKLVDFMTSGRIVAIELLAEGAVSRWRQLIGPTDSEAARAIAPASIRARFGTDKSYNACHGSDAPETAAEECDFFFRQQVGSCFRGHGTCLCLIKPHAVTSGHAGPIISEITKHFEVTAAQSFSLDAPAAAGFFEVYSGVLPPSEVTSMVKDLSSGLCIALEVAGVDGKAPLEPLRALCGPQDPIVARAARPESLRATFGVSRPLNAVHCTDLAEDVRRELDFFFSERA